MKWIGIIGRKRKGKRHILTFNEEVIKAIKAYDGLPIGILVDFDTDSKEEFAKIKPLLDMCHGFILQGGSDYAEIDILITHYLHKKDVPVLGICLGMQTMAMAFGGIMSTTYGHNKDLKYVHDIDINQNTKLYEIIDKKNIPVNSRHNDYIVSTDLTVSSRSDVIEAVEDPSKRFFIGVQWHPESIMDENNKKIFKVFFDAVEAKM